jgi:putative acetyltransferase
MSMVSIRRAEKESDLRVAKSLFEEYAESLDFDLSFQDFDSELANLPGEYARPGGVILVATLDGTPAGCVALRELEAGVCEMKRLYVVSPYRRMGIGRKLAEAVIAEARRIGYRSMRLDTVPGMIEATELYRSLGFGEIEPYRHNPIDGALFFELKL